MTPPLTTAELAAMKERAKTAAAAARTTTWSDHYSDALLDRGLLIAEVERLRAELETAQMRPRSANKELLDQHAADTTELARLQVENLQLHATLNVLRI